MYWLTFFSLLFAIIWIEYEPYIQTVTYSKGMELFDYFDMTHYGVDR